MMFEKIYTRDIIAVLVLLLLFACKILGFNSYIDASIALVIGYYFSKRTYEEYHEPCAQIQKHKRKKWKKNKKK